jgi:DNA-binding response OmpR family regulator
MDQIVRDAPELMLLDLAMPVMDGMTVLAEMRSVWARFTMHMRIC